MRHLVAASKGYSPPAKATQTKINATQPSRLKNEVTGSTGNKAIAN